MKMILNNVVSFYSFTFHYGSILIRDFRAISRLKKIYIPLWFYSNVEPLFPVIQIYKFTFHYGSILMQLGSCQLQQAEAFTFHYGSILIFHSQQVLHLPDGFTFHYGSILISPSEQNLLLT